MHNGIRIKNYAAPKLDEREVLRYAGVRGEADENVAALLRECLKEAETAFSYRVCYCEMTVEKALSVFGKECLAERFESAEKIVVFAATVGLEIDRLTKKYAGISTAKALLFQALGAERIESLCNAFCEDMRRKYEAKGWHIHPRFSPGYGKFPLEKQTEIFALLDCPKTIGVTLSDSLLMSPTKSVTALFAIGKTPYEEIIACARCEKTDCNYRK